MYFTFHSLACVYHINRHLGHLLFLLAKFHQQSGLISTYMGWWGIKMCVYEVVAQLTEVWDKSLRVWCYLSLDKANISASVCILGRERRVLPDWWNMLMNSVKASVTAAIIKASKWSFPNMDPLLISWRRGPGAWELSVSAAGTSPVSQLCLSSL